MILRWGGDTGPESILTIGGGRAMFVAARTLPARTPPAERTFGLACGGEGTLLSYGRNGRPGTLDDVPDRHWEFIRQACVDWYEPPGHLFVHAGALPDLPLAGQPDHILFW